MIQIGVTERGDAAINTEWREWVWKGHPAILISKDPVKVIKDNMCLFYKNLDGRLCGNVILHATITGMGGWYLEPNVPSAEHTLKGLEELMKLPRFVKERIVIRQDPIFIPELILRGSEITNQVFNVARFAKNNNLRYRLSFLDLYPHVFSRIVESYNENLAFPRDGVLCPIKPDTLKRMQPDIHIPLNTRKDFIELLKNKTGLTDEDIEICGEPGLPCTGCISQKDLDIFKIDDSVSTDKCVQRLACACLGIKKELLNNKHRCQHNCLYCYWKD